MSYRVEFHLSALAQLEGLPDEAFDALVKRAADLVDAPWDAEVLYLEEPEFRHTLFGDFGVMAFHVDQCAELIRIFNVTWVD
ncbi:hypothetical protein [Sphaerisporangium fuscum]|uniref:hypothetical protein n=1 Tax=Sphaerisporangium fuscum TaxID=2835868 RepID=UPI001BDD2BDC|nr:hypothetical protein [Sphaerisporangium fuscum]